MVIAILVNGNWTLTNVKPPFYKSLAMVTVNGEEITIDTKLVDKNTLSLPTCKYCQNNSAAIHIEEISHYPTCWKCKEEFEPVH